MHIGVYTCAQCTSVRRRVFIGQCQQSRSHWPTLAIYTYQGKNSLCIECFRSSSLRCCLLSYSLRSSFISFPTKCNHAAKIYIENNFTTSPFFFFSSTTATTTTTKKSLYVTWNYPRNLQCNNANRKTNQNHTSVLYVAAAQSQAAAAAAATWFIGNFLYVQITMKFGDCMCLYEWVNSAVSPASFFDLRHCVCLA